MPATVQRIAAFSDGDSGGNPAGVLIASRLPDAAQMQQIAAEVGYSETAFAMPGKNDSWRVRYFSPESEVPFCGHATIALGAALANEYGNGIFSLELNDADITVEGHHNAGALSAALQSPSTYSKPLDTDLAESVLKLFGLSRADLDPALPPAFAHAGANHVIVSLASRKRLTDMSYDQAAGKTLMVNAKLITIMLAYAESPRLFHTRNPFASGGVYEDPATGAATAALAGYLRDIDWQHGGAINIVQGEDMGCRSLLKAELSDEKGSSIRVSGNARFIQAE
ncbi:PhzF family phenazine biosynthesis protein [Chromatiales bacterium (ex Bugula neritina AB1)]|nr:PhzF family phenazine biosynthesis protein [Chromatiales bacterium (ex Bugula neritina AB1)]